jgi:hypothetical protein
MDYEIIDNFLPVEYYNYLKEHIATEKGFPWYYSTEQVGKDSSYFYHVLFDEVERSVFYEEFHRILDVLKPKELLQARLNLLVNTGQANTSTKHRDCYTEDMSHRTGILYFGSNNGKTVLCGSEGEVAVDSIDNRFLSFESNTEHYSQRQTDADIRIVLNINWLPM